MVSLWGGRASDTVTSERRTDHGERGSKDQRGGRTKLMRRERATTGTEK